MPDKPTDKSTAHCAQCGAPLRADASFCTTCGAPVAASVAPAAQAAQTQPAQRSKLWLALGVAVLLLAAAAAALVWFNNSQQPAPSVAVAIPTVAAASQDIPYPNVARVAAEQAHMSAMAGDALIVDVRGREFYDAGHARGAVSLPLNELPARLSELPKDKAILFYCT